MQYVQFFLYFGIRKHNSTHIINQIDLKKFYIQILVKHLITKTFIFFIICTLLSNAKAKAQVTFQDSLYQVANNPKTSTKERYLTFDRLIFLVRTKDDYLLTSKICYQYINLALINKDYTELTKAYTHLAILYYNQDQYKTMQLLIDTATNYCKIANTPIASTYLNYAKFAQQEAIDQNGEAVKIANQTIPIAEQYQLNFILARLYYELFMIYDDWGKINDAQMAIDKCALYANKAKEINYIIYSNLGKSDILEEKVDQNPNDKVSIERIFQIFDTNIALATHYPHQVSDYVVANLFTNKAGYLLKFKEHNATTLAEANKNIDAGLNLCPKNKNNCINMIANAYGLKAQIAMINHDKVSEEKYLLQAYNTRLTQKAPYFIDFTRDLKSIVDFYKKYGNYEKALFFQEKIIRLKQQQFNEEQSKIAQRYNAQFDSEKKNRLLKEFELKDENRKKMRFLYLGLLVLGIVVVFYIFKSIKLKLQVSLVKQKQLQSEKNEQELQIKFEKEEKQRLKTEQELLELQQQKLQTEVLANRLQLQHKNEVLKQIKENIQSAKTVNIDKLLREESLVDTDFESAVFQIEEVHPNFFKSLNDKSLQKLTPLDLKYCAYIYLGMNAKQIGNLLNVEPKSVRMTKYRLKQKIGFATETTLEDFLKTIA